MPSKTRYIMKNQRLNNNYVYDLFTETFEYIGSIVRTPEYAKLLNLTAISPMQLHNKRL